MADDSPIEMYVLRGLDDNFLTVLQDTLQGMLEEHTNVTIYRRMAVLADVWEYTIYSKWYGLKTRADFTIPADEHEVISVEGIAMICLGAIFDNFLGQIERGFLNVEKVEGKPQITIGLSHG